MVITGLALQDCSRDTDDSQSNEERVLETKQTIQRRIEMKASIATANETLQTWPNYTFERRSTRRSKFSGA